MAAKARLLATIQNNNTGRRTDTMFRVVGTCTSVHTIVQLLIMCSATYKAGYKLQWPFIVHVFFMQLFQNSLSTFAMNQLIMLQEYENEYVLVEDVAHTQSVGHEELHGQHSSENSSNPTAKSGHKSSDNQVQELKDAIQELRSLLRLLKQQESPGVPLYVTYWKLGAGKLQECKTRDLAFPADTAIRYKDLFSKV